MAAKNGYFDKNPMEIARLFGVRGVSSYGGY